MEKQSVFPYLGLFMLLTGHALIVMVVVQSAAEEAEGGGGCKVQFLDG